MPLSKKFRVKPPQGSMVIPGHELAQNLGGAWLFNEGGGGIAHDSSRCGFHGILTGTSDDKPAWVSTPFGSAGLFFDLTNEPYVYVLDRTPYDATDNISCFSWIKTNSSGNHRAIANKGNASTYAWHMRIDTGNGLALAVSAGGLCDGSIVLSADLWYLVGFTFQNGTVKLYVNGVQDGSDHTGRSITANDLDLVFGLLDSGTFPFEGVIGSIFFWNRVLPRHQILKLYHEPWCMYGVNRGVGQTVAAPPAEPKPITIETRTAGPRKYQHHVFE